MRFCFYRFNILDTNQLKLTQSNFISATDYKYGHTSFANVLVNNLSINHAFEAPEEAPSKVVFHQWRIVCSIQWKNCTKLENFRTKSSECKKFLKRSMTQIVVSVEGTKMFILSQKKKPKEADIKIWFIGINHFNLILLLL